MSNSGPRVFRPLAEGKPADHPVWDVTIGDAREYAEWHSSAFGRTVRLPTELEWEHAARGWTTFEYPYGEHFALSRAIAAKRPHLIEVVIEAKVAQSMNDLLIRGALMIDGSGSAGRTMASECRHPPVRQGFRATRVLDRLAERGDYKCPGCGSKKLQPLISTFFSQTSRKA